jgi:hypothetical protein
MNLGKQIRKEKMQERIKGEGLYLFENNTKADLYLPRPTQAGRKLVAKGQQFVGDNYFFSMLRTNELKLIKEMQSPEQQRAAKLITEQPPTVTPQGTMEYVQKSSTQFNEEISGSQQEFLLTENPVDGIKIIK